LHLAATEFIYKRPKKKQLYRQEVPERRSKIYSNKNFPRKFRISGGFPPAMSGRNTAPCFQLQAFMGLTRVIRELEKWWMFLA